jgi:glycosyltransferase XagB
LGRSVQDFPRDVFLERSVSALKNAQPEFSAERTFTRGQGVVLISLPLIALALFFVWPSAIGVIAAISCALAFIANGVFRALLVWVGAGEAPAPAPAAKRFPLYTILVPLYREANVLPQLVRALRALDYPGIR